MNANNGETDAIGGRDVDEQHAMVQHAIAATTEAAAAGSAGRARAAVHNQQVQALTAIALELRELRLRPPRLQVAGDVNTYPGPTA